MTQRRAVSSEHLLFDATNGEDVAAQGDLAGHGDVGSTSDAGEETQEAGEDGDPSGGAVLGNGTSGDMEVNVGLLELVA